MSVFSQIRTHWHFIILLSLGAFLSACSDNQPHPELKKLDAAIRAGDLNLQAKSLKILVEQSKSANISDYQMLLEDINVVKQLNQRAKDRLSQDKFAALDIAISADKKRRNKDSKSIIATILRPYLPYYDIKPFIQQWSYLAVDKVVVKGLMPNPLSPWIQPLSIPAVWPDKQLRTLLQTPNSDILKRLPRFVAEHQQWLEIDRLGARLHLQNGVEHNKASQATPETTPETGAFYEDIVAINQMYNTIVSDLRYYYLARAINLTEQQLADQIDAIEQSLNTSDSKLTDKQILDDRLLDWQNLQYCCQNSLKILHQGFSYLPNPDRYTQKTTDVNDQWIMWLEGWAVNLQHTDKSVRNAASNDSPVNRSQSNQLNNKPSQHQWLANLKNLKTSLSQIKLAFISLKDSHQQTPRRAIAQDYLSVSMAWHQGDFGTLETLLPHISAYRSAITY